MSGAISCRAFKMQFTLRIRMSPVQRRWRPPTLTVRHFVKNLHYIPQGTGRTCRRTIHCLRPQSPPLHGIPTSSKLLQLRLQTQWNKAREANAGQEKKLGHCSVQQLALIGCREPCLTCGVSQFGYCSENPLDSHFQCSDTVHSCKECHKRKKEQSRPKGQTAGALAGTAAGISDLGRLLMISLECTAL